MDFNFKNQFRFIHHVSTQTIFNNPSVFYELNNMIKKKNTIFYVHRYLNIHENASKRYITIKMYIFMDRNHCGFGVCRYNILVIVEMFRPISMLKHVIIITPMTDGYCTQRCRVYAEYRFAVLSGHPERRKPMKRFAPVVVLAVALCIILLAVIYIYKIIITYYTVREFGRRRCRMRSAPVVPPRERPVRFSAFMTKRGPMVYCSQA